jgi:hypothetical protein
VARIPEGRPYMNRKCIVGIAVIIVITIVLSAALLQWAGKEAKVAKETTSISGSLI